MQHFIIDTDFSGDKVQILDKDLLHQMTKVMRFRVGDECVLLNGHGLKVKGVVMELHRKGAVIRLGEREQCVEPGRKIRLFCALSKKPSTFELIVQKATELGVSDIIPVVFERCQVSDLRKEGRLELIIKEACEQSERCFVPELHEVLGFDEFLSGNWSGQLLAGDPWQYDKHLRECDMSGDVNLVIGPEGGLSDEEIQAIREAGGTIFLLGDNVLRMETAAIAAISLAVFG